MFPPVVRSALVTVIAATVLGAGALGCGGGSGPGGSPPVDLTKRLSPGADTYTVADLTGLRADLGLPEDADPFASAGDVDRSFVELAGPSFAALTRRLPSPDLLAAVDLGAVRAAASASTGDEAVTALATDADTGDIGSNLGDLGFEDAGGILSKDGERLSLRLDQGVIFIATDPGILRELPDEPLDELPAPVLGEVDGEALASLKALGGCTRGVGVSADADGSGELALLVDGGADPDRLELDDSGTVGFGDPTVDGDLLKVPVDSERGGFTAYRAVLTMAFRYDCG